MLSTNLEKDPSIQPMDELFDLKDALNEAAAVAITNEEGIITYLNDKGLNQLGYPKEEVIGLHFTQVFMIELKSFAHELWGTINAGGIWKGEIQNRRKDGQAQWMDTTIYPFVNEEGRAYKYLSIQFDVTEKKLVQAKAQQFEKQYLNLVNELDDCIYQSTLTGDLLFVNPAWERITGYTTTDSVGKNLLYFFQEEDLAENHNLIESLLDGKSTKVKRIRQFEHKNGQIIWVEWIAKLILNSQNKPIGISGTIRDITERIEKQEHIDAQKEFYENILNRIPADVVVLDEHQEVIFINPMARRDNKDELPWMLIEDETAEELSIDERNQKLHQTRASHFNDAISKRRAREWEEVLIKGEDRKYVLRRLSPIFNAEGEFVMMIVFGFDITKRKIIQQEERELSDMLGSITSNIPVIAFRINKEKRFEFVQGMGLKTLELQDKDLIGKHLDQLNTELQQHLPTGTNKSSIIELVNKNKEGKDVIMRNIMFPDPTFRERTIGFSLDITDSVENERKMRAAMMEAREAVLIKQRFFANMSHEIRTPMNGILGMIDLMRKTQTTVDQSKYLDIIHRSANNLLILINDILDVEKLESGKMVLEQVPFSIRQTIDSVINLLNIKARENGIELLVSPYEKDPGYVIGDGFRLNQVLVNLVNNGIKFTEYGSVTISLKCLTESDTEVSYLFSIKDTGIGIKSDMQAKIFEEFTQEYSSTARQFGGTGLGLAICKTLIELQGGRIWVESDGKNGSTFSFILTYPKANEDSIPTKDEQDTIADYSNLSGLKVLLAEDNEVNTFYAVSLLEEKNIQVDIAEDGAIALEKMETGEYDLILMDIQMPNMNGLQATERIRSNADPKKAGIPIIACTANAFKGDLEKYLSLGMNDYISKPFDEHQLFDKLQSLLKGSQKIKKPQQLPKPQKVEAIAPNITPIETKLYDLDLLQSTARGNQEFMNKMIRLFLDSFPEYMTELQKAGESGNWSQVKFFAHKMKATIDLIGVASLKEPIRKLESNAAEQKELELMPELILQVNTTLESVMKQIQQEL